MEYFGQKSCFLVPGGFHLAALRPEDYPYVITLWNSSSGVRAAESPSEFEQFLARNPGLSTAIFKESALAAAVLCGHDGRRGYLYHLAVAEEFRRLGLARALVAHSLAGLKEQGISRVSIFLIAGNELGGTFWRDIGWRERVDLKVFAYDL